MWSEVKAMGMNMTLGRPWFQSRMFSQTSMVEGFIHSSLPNWDWKERRGSAVGKAALTASKE